LIKFLLKINVSPLYLDYFNKVTEVKKNSSNQFSARPVVFLRSSLSLSLSKWYSFASVIRLATALSAIYHPFEYLSVKKLYDNFYIW